MAGSTFGKKRGPHERTPTGMAIVGQPTADLGRVPIWEKRKVSTSSFFRRLVRSWQRKLGSWWQSAIKSESAAGVQPEQLIDVNALATHLGMHPETIRKLTRQQMIPALKAGQEWRYRLSEVEAQLRRNADQQRLINA